MTAAVSSVGVASSAKDLILKQEASLLHHVEEQMKETTELLMKLCNERIREDTEILCSMRGIGENTAMNFLVEMGGDIEIYENDKKLIAAAGLDPTTYESGKYKGKSKISKRGNRHLRRVIWLMTTRSLPTMRSSGPISSKGERKDCRTRRQCWPRPINSFV
jgi:transposase